MQTGELFRDRAGSTIITVKLYSLTVMKTSVEVLAMTVRLRKFGHACVRLEEDDRRLVIDPGGLTGASALDAAGAVLVTHEHFDHFSEQRLWAAAEANPNLEIWTNSVVADALGGLGGRVHVVEDGDTVEAAGFEVRVHGTWHEVIHPELPRIRNIGFLVAGLVFHPGDALTVPDTVVDTLLLPVHGPWSTTGQLVDYVREVGPERAVAIHDGALNDTGVAMIGGLLGDSGPGTGASYTRLSEAKPWMCGDPAMRHPAGGRRPGSTVPRHWSGRPAQRSTGTERRRSGDVAPTVHIGIGCRGHSDSVNGARSFPAVGHRIGVVGQGIAGAGILLSNNMPVVGGGRIRHAQ